LRLVLRERHREGWITKDCDSRRSWIGGEGLPSRDQIKEKREQRLSQVGFSQAKPQERVASYKVFPYRIFMYMYMGASGDRRMYMGCVVGTVTYISKSMQIWVVQQIKLCQVCL
jgi:hypothetical protein